MKSSSNHKQRDIESKERRKNRRSRYRVLRQRGKRHRQIKRIIWRTFAWMLFIAAYYTIYSYYFDSHFEQMAKNSLIRMQSDYDKLVDRYDTLELVLEDISRRDSAIFRTLFEAPISHDDIERREKRVNDYESIISLPTSEINNRLRERISRVEEQLHGYKQSYKEMILKVDSVGGEGRKIPAIQPVANNSLVKLTASYGLSMHPFYRTLTMHEGVDYSVAEGTRVFATADGVIEKASPLNSTSGKTITINHENGYKSHYKHLGAINVIRNQRVKRGDIIALSGNSGLSLSPHLHYEISHKGNSVDPLHYFFLELTPQEYQTIQKIAESRRQPLD